jgi:VIT1/CCC1 family predicted Fe2+/Mn2+ transporter
MDVLTQLLSLENIVLCLAVVALVWAQRKLAELLIPSLTKEGTRAEKWWSEFLVPIGPIGTGALLMLIPYLPAPEMFSSSLVSRGIFGIFLGLISGLVYRLVKKNFLNKIGGKNEEEETPYLDE